MSALTPAPRTACYVRVAAIAQDDRQAVETQADVLRRYCDEHGLTVTGIYADAGISGLTALEDRPEGRRLLDHAESGAFDLVLVQRADRLARAQTALRSAHDRLERAGVEVRSATES